MPTITRAAALAALHDAEKAVHYEAVQIALSVNYGWETIIRPALAALAVPADGSVPVDGPAFHAGLILGWLDAEVPAFAAARAALTAAEGNL